MAVTLFLLGTDTSFSQGPVPGAYDVAETLGFSATLIKGEPSKLPALPDIPYSNDNVVVVNGPLTIGSEVGDRIALGVLSILEAIERGENNINIVAHSRGAVEAILVAHEIERIQGLLKASNDRSKLYQSECRFTRKAMSQYKHIYDDLNFNAIKEFIGGVQIAIFNVDPVPGGNLLGLPTGWSDRRFYVLPKIVKEYEQYTYQNERSRAFKGIVPHCTSARTKYSLTSLPGHHGTGSGNLKCQRRTDDPNNKSTADVQLLLLAKILDFLQRQNVRFRLPSKEKNPFYGMITAIFNEAGTMVVVARLKAFYLICYQNILANLSAYTRFNKTCYATGKEQFFDLRSTKDQRIVHLQARQDTYLDEVVPPIAGGQFVNQDHAMLRVSAELTIEATDPTQISSIIDQIIKTCEHYQDAITAQRAQTVTLTDSWRADPFAVAIAQDKEAFRLYLDQLNILINDIKNPFISSSVPDDNKRNELSDVINNAYKRFTNFANEQPNNELAQSILVIFKNNLLSTLQFNYKATIDHYQALQQLADSNFFPLFVQRLRAQYDKEPEDGDLIAGNLRVKAFLDQATVFLVTKPNTLGIRQFLRSELHALEDVPDHELVSLLQILIEESLDYDATNILQQMERSYVNLHTFKLAIIEKYEPLLGDDLAAGRKIVELDSNRLTIVPLAAHYILTQRLDIDRDVPRMLKGNQEFFTQVKQVYLALRKTDPQSIEDLAALLRTPIEMQCRAFIERKLQPLTRDHLFDLAKKIRAIVKVDTNTTDLDTLLTNLNNIEAWPNTPRAKQLNQELDVISNLHKLLSPASEPVIPSMKIIDYYRELSKADVVLKQYCDPWWQRYVTNAVVLASIVLTGILPGLLVLNCFCKTTKFWETSGQTFFNLSHHYLTNEAPIKIEPVAPVA